MSKFRNIAVALIFLLLFQIVAVILQPDKVYAISVFAGGTGTMEDPFLISNAAELDAVRNDLEAHYKLTADIDLSGYANNAGWLPIGNVDAQSPFNGTIDGNDHMITGLTMNRGDENYLGLFGYVGVSGNITNMKLVGVDIIGGAGVGGLAGYSEGTISNSSTTGMVQGTFIVGGLAAYNFGQINNSYSAVNVTGSDIIGGFVGMNIGNVNNTYATGNVIATGIYIGGFTGVNNGGSIHNSFAKGSVTGNDYVGGIAGLNNSGTIDNSFATGNVTAINHAGGLAGNNAGTINNSYYDQNTTGQSDTGKGEPKITADMKDQSTYSAWDFNNTWGMNPDINDGYPYLWALQPLAPPVLQSATAGDGQVSLSWTTVERASGYKIFKRVASDPYDTSLSVSDAVYSYDFTGLTKGTTYYFTIKATNVWVESASSNEVSATPKTVPGAPTAVTATAGNGQAIISFTAPVDDGGSLITSYEVTASPGNNIITGTTSPITIAGLSNGTAYTFTVKAINSVGSSLASTDSGSVTPSLPVSSTQPNNVTPDTPSTPAASSGNSIVELGGDNVGARLQVKADVQTSENGTTSSKVTMDLEQLTQSLASLNDKNDASKTVTITVEGNAQQVNVNLPTAAILNAATSNTQGTIIIQTDTATYDIPLSLLKKLSENLPEGNISITINKVSGSLNNSVIEQAASSQVSLLLDNPIEFKITAGDQEITEFGGTYVERTVFVDQTVDPSTSTAVWYDPSTGTFRFVPSVVRDIDGTTEVVMKSPHNSVYTFIQSNKTFSDLNGHWAKKDIETLASKQIVNGLSETSFAPENKITRAEFVALLVRSLGLTVNATKSSFKDIDADDWFTGDVEAAVIAGLVSGFADGTFQPGSQITREQMAAMIASALKFVGKEPALLTSQSERLARFTDTDKIQTWAKEAAAKSVEAGIINGRTEATFAPGAHATRAEAVSMLRRMLKYIEFIN